MRPLKICVTGSRGTPNSGLTRGLPDVAKELTARLAVTKCMKNGHAILAGITLSVLFSVVGWAEDFSYTINNGTATITQYQGPGGSVIIPSSINQLPVAGINGPVFYNYGFNVTNISLPSTLTIIGDGVFYGCPNLAAITVDAASSVFSSIDGVLF